MDPLALSRFLPSDLSPPSLRWLGGAAVAACLMIGLLLALRRRRRRRRETCWFCLRAQPCPWPAVGWTCVHCQQYNGFTEDGDYDREVPEMYAEGAPKPRYCRGEPQATQVSSAQLLCPRCQQHLAMSVAQLASFRPTSEATFEEEAAEYEGLVRRLYPLCDPCEARTAGEIMQRDRAIQNHILAAPQRQQPSTHKSRYFLWRWLRYITGHSLTKHRSSTAALPALLSSTPSPPHPPLPHPSTPSPPHPPLLPSTPSPPHRSTTASPPPPPPEVQQSLSELSLGRPAHRMHKQGTRQRSWLQELERLSFLTTSQPHCHGNLSGPNSYESPASLCGRVEGRVLQPARLHYQPSAAATMAAPSSLTPPPTPPISTTSPPSTAHGRQRNGVIPVRLSDSQQMPRPPSHHPQLSDPTCGHAAMTFVMLLSFSGNVLLLWLLLTHTTILTVPLFS